MQGPVFISGKRAGSATKIRAVWQAKGKSGERLAVIPPYGYHKDENNPKQLVLEELRDLLAFISRHEKQFVRLVMDKSKQEQARGNCRQKVEIVYHKIGAVDLQSWLNESAVTSA